MNNEFIHIPRNILTQLPTILLRGVMLTLLERADSSGEVRISVRALAKDIDVGYQSLRTALRHLSNAGVITLRAEDRLTLVRISGLGERRSHIPPKQTPAEIQVPLEIEEIPTTASEVVPQTVNYESFQQYYNSLVKNTPIPSILKMTDARKRALKAISEEFGKEAMRVALHKVVHSNFLSQEWGRVSFDWIFNRKNFLKILEGTYDNRTDQTSGSHSISTGPGMSRTATITGVAAEIFKRNHA